MFDQFREIVLCDFEFGSDAGDRPNPVCLVAFELRSGRKHRLWRDEFGPLPPYPTGPDILFTAYYASAEIGCHLALGWPAPARVLDLFTEFRCITNGSPLIAGRGLIGALAHHGLDTISITEKTEMRELAIELGRTGRPATSDERTALLTYCEGDTAALERLLPVMAPQIDLPRALLRGRYMAAVARIEANGVPVDVEMLDRLQRRWDGIQDHLIAELDCEYGVYDGRSFRTDWFEQLLARLDVPWPRLESGRLNLQDKTFRAMATAYPVLNTLRELRASLSSMRLKDIAVGRDGRHRTLLSAFRATSGRNQPSNVNDPRGGKKSVFVFGPATWCED